jgi:hypothetical protein
MHAWLAIMVKYNLTYQYVTQFKKRGKGRDVLKYIMIEETTMQA